MNELYHWGVKGMKWGHRKARPKTAGVGRNHDSPQDEATLKEARKAKTKRALKIGAVVAGTVLASYGTYKLSKFTKQKAFDKAYKRGEAAVLKALRDKKNSEGAFKNINTRDQKTFERLVTDMAYGTHRNAINRSSTTGNAIRTLLSKNGRSSISDIAKYTDFFGIVD